MEHLSDASFLAKVQEFPANVRLGWPVANALAYWASILVTQKKKFYNIDNWKYNTNTSFSS